MRTRHVWIRPPLGVGRPRQGLVATRQLRHDPTTAPMWWAFVAYVDSGDVLRWEWFREAELEPVVSAAPE